MWNTYIDEIYCTSNIKPVNREREVLRHYLQSIYSYIIRIVRGISHSEFYILSSQP